MTQRPAAILAADVVGYSRLIADAEEDTLHRLNDFLQLFSQRIGDNSGRIFSTAGDSIKAEFPTPVDAMLAAWALQKDIRARNASFPLGRQMVFRMGVASGSVVDRDGEPFGPCVTLASGLEGLSAPGGICVSREVHDSLLGEKLWRFADMGIVRPSGAADGVQAYAVIQPQSAGVSTPPYAGPKPATPVAAGGFGGGLTALAAIFMVTSLIAGTALMFVLQNFDPKAGPGLPGSEQPSDPKRLPPSAASAAPPRSQASLTTPAPVVTKPAAPPPSPPALQAPAIPSPGAPARPSAEKGLAVTPDRPAAPAAELAAPTVTPPSPPPSEQPSVQEPAPITTTADAAIETLFADCLGTDRPRVIGGCRALLTQAGKPQIAPRVTEIQLKLGTALREAGRTIEAIETLLVAVRLAPTAAAHIQLGVAHYEKGDYAAAIASFSAAIALEPNNGEAYNDRAWVRYKSGQFTEAADDASHATRHASGAPFVWDTSGHINEARGLKEAAIADFRRAVQLDPNHVTSLAALARLGAAP